MAARRSRSKTPSSRTAAGSSRAASRAAKNKGGKAAGAAPAPTADTPLQLLAPDGTWGGARPCPLDAEALRGLLRAMLRIRILDERMLLLQRQGRIGFFGQTTGQEAAVVGSAAALEPRDWILPALRESGAALLRGYSLNHYLAQLAGRDGEVSRGRQMPCHFSWRDGRFVSMSSVIGTQIAHAAGMARAAQIRGDDVVVLGYLGDGATSANDFHAALNFAGVWRAPVVFFCQNNQWAISVPFERQTAAPSIAVKATGYGMPGVRVDGNDVLAVLEVTRRAVERARGGEGPTLIEALTYRRLGHSSSDDPTRYRDAAEVEQWERLDPIDRLRGFLLAEGALDAAALEALEEEIHQEISEAVRLAEQAPQAPLESLVEDVFACPTPQLESQIRALLEYGSRQDITSRGPDR